MARYTYNCDKYCCYDENGLYNTVVSIEKTETGTEPVTVQEAKDWAKIEQDVDDVLIEELITAAREVCEDYTGIGFITRDMVATINNANGGFVLPYGPVQGDVVVTDNDGTWSDLRGEYEVSYTGGYADGALPKKFKTAIKQQFLFMYENRGESNTGVAPYTVMILQSSRMVA
jgi:hypothetical protein